jgi:hypothetical protein
VLNAPSTAREALIKELLGDMDVLLKRAEALPDQILDSESKIKSTVALIDSAGDRYRLAVTAFNEQAKKDLSEFADQKIQLIAQTTAKSLEEHRASLKMQQSQSLDPDKIAELTSNLIGRKFNSLPTNTKSNSALSFREYAMLATIVIASWMILYLILKPT